jgi:hypothetical protein
MSPANEDKVYCLPSQVMILSAIITLRVSYFCGDMTKLPERKYLTGGKIILDQSFRGVCPWLLAPMHLGRTSQWQNSVFEKDVHLRKQREREEGTNHLQSYAPSDPLPLARPHLLKFPVHSKIVLTARDQSL